MTAARRRETLAIRELRRLARLVQAGFLALDLAGVAREIALALERDTQLRVEIDERAGDAVPHRAGLAGEPAAVHAHAQVVLAVEARRPQGRGRERLPHRAGEVLLQRPAVHPRGAVAGSEDDAGDRGLALAGEGVRDLRGEPPQGLALGVDEIPLARDLSGLG